MGKKKDTKKIEKKRIKALKNRSLVKKVFDFLVDEKPMSQIVHWTIILSIVWLYLTKIADATVILNNIWK